MSTLRILLEKPLDEKEDEGLVKELIKKFDNRNGKWPCHPGYPSPRSTKPEHQPSYHAKKGKDGIFRLEGLENNAGAYITHMYFSKDGKIIDVDQECTIGYVCGVLRKYGRKFKIEKKYYWEKI